LPAFLRQLTPTQLLSHTAGLTDDPIGTLTPEKNSIQGDVRSWPPEAAFTGPGLIYSYSSPKYTLAGALLETLSGKSYADSLREALFVPTRMTQSTAYWPGAISNQAQGHDFDANGEVKALPSPGDVWGARAPAGGVLASARDLGNYMLMLLNDGRIGSQRVIPPTVVALMWEAHAEVPGTDGRYAYGYGWVITHTADSTRIVEADGGSPGFVCSLLLVPERHFGIAITANLGHASFPRTTAQSRADLASVRQLEPASASNPVPLSADDLRELPGKYSLGAGKVAQIVLSERTLTLRYGPVSAPFTKLSADRFHAGPWVVNVIRSDDGKVRYLSADGPAAVRLN
jgi:CubicO group peptidase (beta-lactamase class C family)